MPALQRGMLMQSIHSRRGSLTHPRCPPNARPQAHVRSDEAGRITCADSAALQAAYRAHECLDFFDYSSYDAPTLHPHLLSVGGEGTPLPHQQACNTPSACLRSCW